MIDPTFVVTTADMLGVVMVGLPAVAGATAKAAAWAVKRELNGSAQRIKNIDARTADLEKSHVDVRDRLIRIETIVEERTS